MRNKISDKQRLLHILDAITEIEKYTKGVSKEDFMNQSMMRFACIKQIEIIGEAANSITSETQTTIFRDSMKTGNRNETCFST